MTEYSSVGATWSTGTKSPCCQYNFFIATLCTHLLLDRFNDCTSLDKRGKTMETVHQPPSDRNTPLTVCEQWQHCPGDVNPAAFHQEA